MVWMKFVSDKMLDDLCIAGTPDIAVKKLNAFQDVGIDSTYYSI